MIAAMQATSQVDVAISWGWRGLTLLFGRAELLEKLIIFVLLYLELFYAFVTNNEALGRIKDFLFDDRGRLPALHTLLLALEFGCLGPHAVNVLEIVLQTHD